MNNRKIALLAIPVLAAIMIGATVAPVYAGLSVAIDIKPGSDPNSINPQSRGVISVPILGSDTFDVTEVNLASLGFGPSGASPTHPNAFHLEDVNDDGFTDLVTHYRIQQTGIVFGDTEACLTGETLGGQPFGPCDSINTFPGTT